MLARKTSKQYCPIASPALKPVVVCAARLKDVILLLGSMVKTPSLILSRMVQQGGLRAEVILQNMGSLRARVRQSFWFCGVVLFMESSQYDPE